MSVKTIAFLSNTITKPFDRFLKAYEITHYPLDTIIPQLYATVPEDVLILILDIGFFKPNYEERLSLLKHALIHFRAHNHAKIIINTLNDTFYDIFTPYTLHEEQKLVTLNTSIASLQQEIHDVAILDFYALCKEYGTRQLINEHNGYLFQMPFTKMAVELLSTQIQERLELFTNPRIKAIAVDADNTLWGGIVGEDGIEGIHIDNNYPGIIYSKFQYDLLALKKSGIILILLSKNDESLVHKVFETKTMPLSLDDFVATSINWNAKSENLSAILERLNLTKSGIIFLDDSATEIEEMRQRMGIACYKMNPENPRENLATLRGISALKTLHISEEDLSKTALYKQENARLSLSSTLVGKEEFIASLEIELEITCNNANHLERITQLINKTNQFNLTTKRYDLAEVKAFMHSGNVYDFSVKDKFGDMGIVGVVIIKENTIDTFAMSCRVLGRGIEECVLSIIAHKYPHLKASYIKTDKNALVEHFYEQNGFTITHQDSAIHYEFAHFVDVNESIKVKDES
jgi:FkbH-like protein